MRVLQENVLRYVISSVTVLGAFISFNALSFRYRGTGAVVTDAILAIGFPFEFWREGGMAYQYNYDTEALAWNVVIAVAATAVAVVPVARFIRLPQTFVPKFHLKSLLCSVLILCVCLGIPSLLPEGDRFVAMYSLSRGPIIALAVAIALEFRSEFPFRLSAFLLLMVVSVIVLLSEWHDRHSPELLSLEVFANWCPQLWVAWVWCFTDIEQYATKLIRDFRDFR